MSLTTSAVSDPSDSWAFCVIYYAECDNDSAGRCTDYVGSSYDQAAWDSCLTSLSQRVAAGSS